MNWLAHILLSDNPIDYQLGNLLADRLKCRAWQGASVEFHAGMRMHRSIDRFTDTHPLVRQSKSRLNRKGYLRGVVIDITYDHLLARNWQRYVNLPLGEFVNTFHRRTRQAMQGYPDSARTFLSRLIDSGHLMDYASMRGIENALLRIDGRLSQRVRAKETTLGYLPLVEAAYPRIERDFSSFMPDLIRHFKAVSGASAGSHWLR